MTAAARPFEVLFLTNFSNHCFRAIPALAQMSDEIDLRLTILHAYDDERREKTLEANLRNFFPEADQFSRCRRVLERGTAFNAVRRLRSEQPVDLIVAPAGDPGGLRIPGHVSLRSRLIRETGTPVWTNGRGTETRRLVRPTRHVACVLEPGRDERAHLRIAGEYAERVGATLHVIYLLPDLFDEGSLLMMGYEEPFDVTQALKLLRRELPRTALRPDVHLADRSRLPDLLGSIDADLVFLDGLRWTSRWSLLRRVHGLVDEMPCPSICVNGARHDLHWPIRLPERQETTTADGRETRVTTEEPVGVPVERRTRPRHEDVSAR